MRHRFNEAFFDNPDTWTEKQAYWLGWYYSDGANSNGQISFKIQEQDKDVLESLKNIIGYDGPLGFQRRKPSSVMGQPVKQHQNRWSLTISRTAFCHKLDELGFQEERFPVQLRKELYPHFIRGLYEGDGTFCFTKYNKFETNLLAKKNVLEEIQRYLSENNIESYVKETKFSNGVKILRLCGNEKSIRLFNLLYKDATYVLDRKITPFIKMYRYKVTKNLVHKSMRDECERFYNLIQRFIS